MALGLIDRSAALRREPEVVDADQEQRAGQTAQLPSVPELPGLMTQGADGSSGPPPVTEEEAAAVDEMKRAPGSGSVLAGRAAPRPGGPAPTVSDGGPPVGPVPQVPPPPVSFQLGGAGGGEGASSFARPGSAAARPFRSSQFASSRAEGAGPSEGRRAGFGAGAAIAGGSAPPVSDFGASGDGLGTDSIPEEELQRIMAQVTGRYQGGQ